MGSEKYEKIEARYLELEQLLADPQVLADQSRYQKLAKEYSDITPVVVTFRSYKETVRHREQACLILEEKHDAEFKELAEGELEELTAKEKQLLDKLNELTNPKKKESDRDLIMEIRAGTGGGEASLFAADLYRMYVKYADRKGWKVEAISSNASETKGLKEVIFSISGKGAERCLKWESGAHRVQRVPETETSGRIHTSAATVAILFEPEDIDITIDPKDLKIDIFR
ncbi:MAG TPA: PCRF domain-containing protein, partial [Candidatus Omnitrophota bacterium]|nr:PCRF domain-containing protein [Candidatus Omnitrophota bacterium]